jgi:NTE family protein
MDQPLKVALALGSGGARGYAHIGVIQVLQERGVEFVTIAGSSMGALVGGLLAAGKLAEYTEWVVDMSQFDVLRMLDVSLSAPGAIRAEKVFARVRELLGDAMIEDLPIPFTAVATDLLARREVWFQRGPCDIAIRASIAIPGVFTPVMLNGRMLVDGGVMDPIPIAPTASVQADVTIAVSLGGERRGVPEAVPVRESTEDAPLEDWGDRFRRGASALLDRDVVRSWMSRFGSGTHVSDDAQEAALDEPASEAELAYASLGRFDVMNQSLEAMQSVLTRYCLAAHPPDVMVTIPKDACRSVDFHRARDLIAIGRALTIEALDSCGVAGLGSTALK